MSADPTRAGSDAELRQMSVYLLSPGLEDFHDALRDPDPLQAHDVVTLPGLRGRIYLQPGQQKAPPWLAFLQAIADGDLGSPRNQHASAVLFLESNDQTFALTFGFGRHLLKPEAIESDFGLKVAAGIVDPEEVSGIDSRAFEGTRLLIRRQSSTGTSPQAIGIDLAREMMRAVSGRVADADVGTRVSGSDSVGLTTKVGVREVGDRLDALYAAYSNHKYRERFAHIDRWQAVPRSEAGPYDEELEAALERFASGVQDRRLSLAAPEIVDWRSAGFRYSVEPTEMRHAFPDLQDYLAARDGQAPALKELHRDQLWLYADEPDEVSGHWSIYHSLNWEVQRGDDVLVFTDGRWWRIDAQYRQRIDDRLRLIPPTQLERPPIDVIEHEVDYNLRLAGFRPNRAFLDRFNATFQGEAGTVEICDVFTGDRQFVHVKREAASQPLSHLFAQAAVSADLFRHLPEFRRQLRDHLAAKPSLRGLVPDGRPEPGAYEVVLAIVSPASDDEVALELPFFSRNHLARIADGIERYDYRLSICAISERTNVRPVAAGKLYRDMDTAERRAALRMG
jgi:uncharacterized protein (TIGR04141 family)